MVNAATVEECDAVYEQMMSDLEAAGLTDVEAVITESYKERMELWGTEETTEAAETTEASGTTEAAE